MLLVGAIEICSAEPPRVFGRILNQNLFFQRQELPEDDNIDGPYPPAVPELPLEPPQEYGPPSAPPQEYGSPPQIPATSYGVPATLSQLYGAPEPEAERIVIHPAPAKLSVRHIYRVPVRSERIIVPSHHHAERLVVPSHHHHAERLVVPSHHHHAERLVIPSNHYHSERLLVPSHHHHHAPTTLHSERLVGPTHAHLHSAAAPATVIRLRFSEE